jgi:hypothetical protein
MSVEITTKSWWTRIKDAFIGIFLGIALIIGSIVLIFWNESHGLHMEQSLEQTKKVLVSIPIAPVNPQNNLKAVYISGLATTKDNLTDSKLGITENAISLDRQVEMYQWKENVDTKIESQTGGSEKETKTYSYKQVWSDSLIDSSGFKDKEGHQNPTSMPIKSLTQYAKTVTVGDFSLPDSLIKQINESQSVDLAQVDKDKLKNTYNKKVTLVDDQLFLGENSQDPVIGDLQIKLSVVHPKVVSIIGQQTDNSFSEYVPPAGEGIMLLSTGKQSSDQMISDALSSNKLMTWIWRAVSLILLIVGFGLIFKPLVVLADFLPFLGSIVGFGTGFISFILGLGVWVIMTAIAWFTTRPLLSIGLVVMVAVVSYILIKMKGKTVIVAPPVVNETKV